MFSFAKRIAACLVATLISTINVAASQEYHVPANCFSGSDFPSPSASSAGKKFQYKDPSGKRAEVTVYQEPCQGGVAKAALLMQVSPIDVGVSLSASSFRIDQLDAFPTSITFYSKQEHLQGVTVVAPEGQAIYLFGALSHRAANDAWIYEFSPQEVFTLTINVPGGTQAYFNFAAIDIYSSKHGDSSGKVFGLLDGRSDLVSIQVSNISASNVDFRGTLYGPDGKVRGRQDGLIRPGLAPGKTILLTLDEIKSAVGADSWSGFGTLQVSLPLEGLVVSTLVRTPEVDATGDLSCVSSRAAYNLPGPANVDSGSIVLYNVSAESVTAHADLFHESGVKIGKSGAKLPPVPALGSIELSSRELAKIFEVEGWDKRGRMELTGANSSIRIMNLVRSGGAFLTNMSCPVFGAVYNITSSKNQDVTYLRFVNTSDEAIDVKGTLYSQDGVPLSGLNVHIVKALPAKATVVLSSSDLERNLKVPAWDKRAWLDVLSGGDALRIYALVRTPAGVLMDNTCSQEGRVFGISDGIQSSESFVRITNTRAEAIDVRGELRDKNGKLVGSNLLLSEALPSKATQVLSSKQLDALAGKNWGDLGSLRVTPESGLKVLHMSRSARGVLSNLSCNIRPLGNGFTPFLTKSLSLNADTIQAGSLVSLLVRNNTAKAFGVVNFSVLNGSDVLEVRDDIETLGIEQLKAGESTKHSYTFLVNTMHKGIGLTMQLRDLETGTVYSVSAKVAKP